MTLAATKPIGDRAMARPVLRELPRERWALELKENQRSGLSGFLDFEVLELVPGRIRARLPLRDELMMAAGDFVHGGTIVAFADTCAGWATLASLPEGVTGATTAEMKVNVVATTQVPDALLCVATMLHGGRTTQVWDVAVSRERDGRDVAHFRCTQHLLRPRG
jgi:1,4-dihydroxy-2-naphthoyl-CoA hydrolase